MAPQVQAAPEAERSRVLAQRTVEITDGYHINRFHRKQYTRDPFFKQILVYPLPEDTSRPPTRPDPDRKGSDRRPRSAALLDRKEPSPRVVVLRDGFPVPVEPENRLPEKIQQRLQQRREYLERKDRLSPKLVASLRHTDAAGVNV
jgi:hypothetical protein